MSPELLLKWVHPSTHNLPDMHVVRLLSIHEVTTLREHFELVLGIFTAHNLVCLHCSGSRYECLPQPFRSQGEKYS